MGISACQKVGTIGTFLMFSSHTLEKNKIGFKNKSNLLCLLNLCICSHQLTRPVIIIKKGTDVEIKIVDN